MTAPRADENNPKNPAPFGAQSPRSALVVYVLAAAYIGWVGVLIYFATATRGA